MNKQFTGVVVSAKMQKTIVIDVERRFQHAKYRKVITLHRKFKAHCEDETVKEGDVVTIQSTKPISKDKHFIVIKKVSSKPVVEEAPVKEVKKTVAKPRKTTKRKTSKK